MAGFNTFEAQSDSVVARVKELARRQIVDTANREHAKIMEAPPEPLDFKTHVDGQAGASFESVKPGGVIVVDYNRLDLVASVALDTLRQLSPFKEGNYVRGHVLMLNGKVVDTLEGWKSGDRITISNTEPYTRKIESGKNGFEAHPHVYEKAERVLQRRFGNIAGVFFEYDKAPPGAMHDWAKTTKLTGKGRPLSSRTRAEWLLRQPTLVIKEYR
jgi:hypothetical protein